MTGTMLFFWNIWHSSRWDSSSWHSVLHTGHLHLTQTSPPDTAPRHPTHTGQSSGAVTTAVSVRTASQGRISLVAIRTLPTTGNSVTFHGWHLPVLVWCLLWSSSQTSSSQFGQVDRVEEEQMMQVVVVIESILNISRLPKRLIPLTDNCWMGGWVHNIAGYYMR